MGGNKTSKKLWVNGEKLKLITVARLTKEKYTLNYKVPIHNKKEL